MPDMAKAYDEQADRFAGFAPESFTFAHIERPAYDRHIQITSGMSALDIGAGSGRMAEYLMGRGVEQMTGVEISPNLVKIAQQRVPKAQFLVGDAREPINVEPVDLITSHMVMEFLDPDGLGKMLTNVYRLLKKGGVFCSITTHPHKMSLKHGLNKPGWFGTKSPWGDVVQNWYRVEAHFERAYNRAGLNLQVMEDLHVPPESEQFDPDRYAFVKRLDPVRLLLKATKGLG